MGGSQHLMLLGSQAVRDRGFGLEDERLWCQVFSRSSRWLGHQNARFVWVSHALHDGMLLLPSQWHLCSLLLAWLSYQHSECWRKVHLGSEIVWIGWRFCFKTATAALPSDKVVKILDLLQPLCVAKAKDQRKHVAQIIGILIWYRTVEHLGSAGCFLQVVVTIPKKLSVSLNN